MDNQILLTISIPTYNRATYLDRCFASIMKQYNAQFKVDFIVSDNCSTDHTADVVKKYIDLNLPIQYIKNESNIGPDLNIAQCYYLAKGKYVVAFGDDDVFLEGYLAYTINLLQNNYGVVFFNYYGFLHNEFDEAPRFNFFNSAYLYKNESILKITRSRVGFTSASIVNSRFINKEKLIADVGTNFNHLPLIIGAMMQSSQNLYVGKYLIAQQNSNSGGFSYFRVFGQNLYRVINNTLGNQNKAVTWISNHLLLKFFPGAILNWRKTHSAANTDEEPMFYLKPNYNKYWLFWLCCYPVAKLPYSMALLYCYSTKVLAKLRDVFYNVPLGKKFKNS